MPGVNRLWSRWVVASVANHLHTVAAADTLPLVVELLDKRTNAWKTAIAKAEATISGPSWREVREGSYELTLSLFVVVTSDRSGTNDYEHVDHVGTMANALDQCITVKDYGPTGTGLLTLGTITPQGAVDVETLKPKETDDQIFSTVKALYAGNFTE